MDEQEGELLEECIELVQRYGKCLLGDPNCDAELESEELLPEMMYFCDELEKYKATQKVFNNFINDLEKSEDLNDVDENEVLENYNTLLAKSLSHLKLRKQNKLYKEFENLLSSRTSEKHDESDITAVSETVSHVDPLTKLRLTDPVKNIKCGHIYEKATIMQLISSKKNVKCPIAGCVAADSVKKRDLVPDASLKRFLELNPDT